MGIYNCRADFHPFLLSLYFTSSLLLFYFYSLPYGTVILSFNNSEEDIFAKENFLYPNNIQNKKGISKFTAIFGVFPTRPRKLFLQINLCLCIIINYFTSTAIRIKLFRSQLKRNGIFQSVQDYFSVFMPLFPFVFALLQLCEREESHNE